MNVCILSGAVMGIDAYRLEVEVDVSNGHPTFDLVGLADGAVRESRVRVRSALKNAGFPYPLHTRRITVNLAPADIRKEGAAFDLPIALGLLAAFGIIPAHVFQDILFVGELALNGDLRPVRGALPIAVMARQEGLRAIVVPRENAPEAAAVEGLEVFGCSSLGELVDFLMGEIELESWEAAPLQGHESQRWHVDLQDVKGQEHVKRALEIAAAGLHNLLMIGPPGCGKTMLARRLSTLLPPLSFEESLETTKIYSVCGLLQEQGLMAQRPFRSPHHTISEAGLVGGGTVPRPGEISLAHRGVLFLDELPEFRRNVLDVLRQPIEERAVTIARVASTLRYPCDFLLVAAMNPCPCGHAGGNCRCGQVDVNRYQGRISGPLMDRIDLHVEVPAVPFQDLREERLGESSSAVRERVIQARTLQSARFANSPLQVNSQMQSKELRNHCRLNNDAMRLLERATQQFGMSARAFDRILKVARTIADLDAQTDIQSQHIAEAIQYRTLDRRLSA
ncbi:MAG: YifB family Mg chelatase-like AAA ATPase [Myxococcales bacterium]|nr:YifB family Mg chelatase-like AAA ATPase [Myxococcales bacterium]MCB9643831.1 YifB family Mg chelatase-like AAA ATPase [Myxococcales bacterium]